MLGLILDALGHSCYVRSILGDFVMLSLFQETLLC